MEQAPPLNQDTDIRHSLWQNLRSSSSTVPQEGEDRLEGRGERREREKEKKPDLPEQSTVEAWRIRSESTIKKVLLKPLQSRTAGQLERVSSNENGGP